MPSVVFIYKKKQDLFFLNLEDALSQESDLKKKGWAHVKTIDPAIMMARIYDVCQEEFSGDEKIDDIIKLLIK